MHGIALLHWPAASALRDGCDRIQVSQAGCCERSQLLLLVRLAASCSSEESGDAASEQAGGCGTQAKAAHSSCNALFLKPLNIIGPERRHIPVVIGALPPHLRPWRASH
jgi:hypothetical protein